MESDDNNKSQQPKGESLMETENNAKPISINGGKEAFEEQDEEEFNEEFQCCICLELLYKPVVLACGHLSCFWCVYKSMNLFHESYCHLCRHPYNHFPNICQLLHFLLLKLYPIAYKKRERQVREEEKKDGNFSPQFDVYLFQSHPNEELDSTSNSLNLSRPPPANLSPENCFSWESKDSSLAGSLESTFHNIDIIKPMPLTSSRCDKGTSSTTITERSQLGKDLEHGTQKQVSVTDLLCAKCKKLLFRPVVLNCGHVYCESCIIVREEGLPRCSICQSLHPNGFPRVCFVLEHFLQEKFAQIYAEQAERVPKQPNSSKHPQQPAMLLPLDLKDLSSSSMFGNGLVVHRKVGCDSCGMTPIIGKRYKCKDCVELIGFDLCERCYKNPSKILGRFNQQHKPEHSFEIIMSPRSISDLFFGSGNEHFDEEDGDHPEDQEEGVFVPHPNLFNVALEEDVNSGSYNMENVASDQEDDDSNSTQH